MAQKKSVKKVAPGTYDVILYETSNHPGLRLENVIIEEGKTLPENSPLVISPKVNKFLLFTHKHETAHL